MNLEERVERLEKIIKDFGMDGPKPIIRTSALELVDDDGNRKGAMVADDRIVTLQLGSPDGAGVTIGVADSGADVIVTHADGEPGAQLSTNKEGQSILAMYDTKGEPRVRMVVTDDEPAIDLCDKRGKARLVLTLHKDGSPGLSLIDSKNNARMSLVAMEGEHQMSSIRLFDAEGKDHISIGVDGNGQPSFLASDPEGKQDVLFLLKPQGGCVVMSDRDEKPRLAIGLSPEGHPFINMFNDLGERRITLSMDDENNGLVIHDSHGQDRVMMAVNADERPHFTIRDDAKQQRIRMALMPDGTPGIALNDAQGKTAALLSASKQARGLTIHDEHGKTRAALVFGEAGPGLLLADENGEIAFQAP